MKYQFCEKPSSGDLELLKRHRWEQEGERHIWFWLICRIAGAWVGDNFGIFPAREKVVAISSGNGFWKWYFHKKDIAAGRAIFNRALKDKTYLKSFKRACERDIKGLKELSNKLLTLGFKKLSTKELLALQKVFIDKYMRVSCYVGPIRTMNKPLLDYLFGYFRSKGLANPPLLVEQVTRPRKSSVFEEFKRELLKVKIKDVKFLKESERKEFKQVLEKFKWLTVGYFDEAPLSLNYLLETLKALKKERVPAVKKSTISLPAGVSCAAEIASTFTYYKDRTRAAENFAHFVSQALFREIGARFGGGLRVARNVLPQEIKPGLKTLSPHLGPGLLLGDREKKVLKIFWLSKKECEEITKIVEKPEKVKVISGIPASLGKARGKVLCLRRPKDYKGQKGFVFVAGMTTPEFFPVLRKAKAIITDEGGITCHAAIVSRELGIPCVIGTNIATKALKDNDIVEVDADKGTVKILKTK